MFVIYNQADLEKAAEQIAFDMFHFRLYASEYKRMGDAMCFQAILYALLLHFRLLVDFFYATPVKDDCCAEHFRVLPGFETAFPPSIHVAPSWKDEVRLNLHKRLAHFTATRWKERRPNMDYYAKHFDEITRLIEAFAKALPGNVGVIFAQKFNQFKNQYPNSAVSI
jgi:hypothetical protein